ncbi:MAG: acyltransferase [Stomatobaculum sp.]|nr:acyltransferase [Stomatobaculum sp.]
MYSRSSTKSNTEQGASPAPRRERDLTLDLVKGIAILLVIMVHNMAHTNGESAADMVVMTFSQCAIPCFFMAAGAVYLNGPGDPAGFGKGDAVKQFRKILRVYLGLAFWKALYLAVYHSFGAPVPGMRDILTYVFLFGSLPGVNTSHFWFMEAYITILLIAPLLKEVYLRNRGLFLYIAFVLFLFENGLTGAGLLVRLVCQFILHKEPFLLGNFGAVDPFHFQYSFCIFYYMAGGVLYEKRREFPRRYAAVSFAAGLLGLILIRYSQYETFLWKGSMVVSGHFWVSTLLMASGFFLLLTGFPGAEGASEGPGVPGAGSRLPRAAEFFARTVGQSTEMIFYIHMPLLVMIDRALYPRLLPYDGILLCAAESLIPAALGVLLTFAVRGIKDASGSGAVSRDV